MPSQKMTRKEIKNNAALIIQRSFKKIQKKIEKKTSSKIISPTTHILEEENICNDYTNLLKEKPKHNYASHMADANRYALYSFETSATTF